MIKKIIVSIFIFINLGICTEQSFSAASSITYASFGVKIVSHFLEYSHYRIIGSCFWWKLSDGIPKPYPTLELDEYLPDLVVAVFENDSNPLWEAQAFDKVDHTIGDAVTRSVLGVSLENGHTNLTNQGYGDNSLITKTVDVLGSPLSVLHLPLLNLRSDTIAYEPYYQSDLDTLGGRLGTAEAATRIPELLNPFSHFIGGNFYKNWGSEFPREMTVNVHSNFKAAVIMALRASDLVTNKNLLHTVISTNNSCGKNCAVANVIEENKRDHEIIEEIYPNDRLIQPGVNDDDAKEIQDEKSGDGKYIFLIWRHYRGCVQGDHYIGAIQRVKSTIKR